LGKRNVIHIDANTTDRDGQSSAGTRGQRFRESWGGSYIDEGVTPQQFQNLEKPEKMQALRELARLNDIKEKGELKQAIDITERLVDPRIQSEQIASIGQPAQIPEEEPKGMSPELLDKLKQISEIKPGTETTSQEVNSVIDFRPSEQTYRSDVRNLDALK
ncbi:hypothetical protein, partial [Nocardia mangyaensis]|uniref:hypothetical protein n=1 Tax=Nocardia mangyaensis TaxID=2213200 RepID=UPI0026774676